MRYCLGAPRHPQAPWGGSSEPSGLPQEPSTQGTVMTGLGDTRAGCPPGARHRTPWGPSLLPKHPRPCPRAPGTAGTAGTRVQRGGGDGESAGGQRWHLAPSPCAPWCWCRGRMAPPCPPSQGTPRLGVTGPHGAGPQLPRTVPPPWMGTRRRPTGSTGTAPGGAAPRHGVVGVSPTPRAAPAHQAEPQLPVPGPPVCNWANWDRASEVRLLPAPAAPVLPSSETPKNRCLTQGFGPPTPSFRNTPPLPTPN